MGFLVSYYLKLNGYTNKFWGWGAEDDEMMARLNIANININVSIDEYLKLCDDGNGTEEHQHFMPTFDRNHQIVNELKQTKNLYYSGLNDLNYKILEESEYLGVKKYLVE